MLLGRRFGSHEATALIDVHDPFRTKDDHRCDYSCLCTCRSKKLLAILAARDRRTCRDQYRRASRWLPIRDWDVVRLDRSGSNTKYSSYTARSHCDGA